MGSYKIRRLIAPQIVIEMLEKQNLSSCKDVLSHTKLELQTLLGVSCREIDNLWQEVCKKCVSSTQTAYDIYMNQQSTLVNGFLSSSLHTLDLLLHGGLSFGNITEITGPPGVGKTQFCFMLSILASLPVSLGGLEGRVIYIDTESAFCADRLRIIAQNKFPHLLEQEDELINLLKRILLYKVNSVQALKEMLPQLETVVIRNNVKLIIIDSIASLIRKEFRTEGFQSLMERNKLLLEQAALLKDLAQTYNIVIFLTNQIASQSIEMDPSLLHDSNSDEEDSIASKDNHYIDTPSVGANPKRKARFRGLVNSDHVIPALGNTWSHCVNTRLVAHFLGSNIRQLTIAKSPVAPNSAVRYTIGASGLILTDDDIEYVNVSNRNQSIVTKNSFLTSEITGSGVMYPAATIS